MYSSNGMGNLIDPIKDGINTLIDPIKLERLAETAIRVGVRLQKGQDLLISAPVEALPFVRLLTIVAYKEGARVVTPLLSDDEFTLAKYRYGYKESHQSVANWLYEGMANAFSENTARLAVVSPNPFLLAQQDPENVSTSNKALAHAYKPALQFISDFRINWSIISYPNLVWAKLVFPNLSNEEAFKALSEAIFMTSRINHDDIFFEWESHNKSLADKSSWLTKQNFSALHFKGPNTDLKIGLAEDHVWVGGATTAKNSVVCNPNIPTEEVFTTPHALRVNGYVTSTKPLSHQGTLIEDIRVKFEEGKIVEAKASRGEEVLQRILNTDEGARRLGEVALVPHSSPISKSGILFYNTLFDENAASHIALGQCYSECFSNSASLNRDQIIEKGGNQSLIHIDWMIGSNKIDVDGVLPDGTSCKAVMRQGEWLP